MKVHENLSVARCRSRHAAAPVFKNPLFHDESKTQKEPKMNSRKCKIWVLAMSLCLGAIFMLPATGWAREQKPVVNPPSSTSVVTKIGKITVTQARLAVTPKAVSPPQQPVTLPVVVSCNGGTTTITCPDGMTAACVNVVRDLCN